MPYFHRSFPAPVVRGGYRGFRPFVRIDFASSCAYCLLKELLAGGQENFELDHFRPTSLFPEDKENFYNLYWACHPCNHLKRAQWPSAALQQADIGFVDLCEHDFAYHFVEHSDGRWEGVTDRARYTIDALRLNRRHLIEIRVLVRRLHALGIDPAASA